MAAYEVYQTAMDGTWTAGIRNLGLAEDGVGWALDEHNEALISAEMAQQVEAARARNHRRRDGGARLHGDQLLPVAPRLARAISTRHARGVGRNPPCPWRLG